MILFVDESYEPRPEGGIVHVLGAVLVDEYRFRAIEAGMLQEKLRYLEAIYADGPRVPPDLREVARTTEFKGRHLLKRSQLRKQSHGQSVPGANATARVLDLLIKCHARAFVQIDRLESRRVVETADSCPDCYRELLRSVATFRETHAPRRPVLMVFDTIHGGIDSRLGRSITDYLYKSRDARVLRCFVPVPFWVASDSNSGSQAADIVAYVGLRSELSDGVAIPAEIANAFDKLRGK